LLGKHRKESAKGGSALSAERAGASESKGKMKNGPKQPGKPNPLAKCLRSAFPVTRSRRSFPKANREPAVGTRIPFPVTRHPPPVTLGLSQQIPLNPTIKKIRIFWPGHSFHRSLRLKSVFHRPRSALCVQHKILPNEPIWGKFEFACKHSGSSTSVPEFAKENEPISRRNSVSCNLDPQLPIPKGLRHKAQGCEERATLGKHGFNAQPQRGCGFFPHLQETEMRPRLTLLGHACCQFHARRPNSCQ
jgi:hypothetical protein